jgi:hypothetical protein
VKPGFVGAALTDSAKDRKMLFASRFRFRRSVAGKPAAGLGKYCQREMGAVPGFVKPTQQNRPRRDSLRIKNI